MENSDYIFGGIIYLGRVERGKEGHLLSFFSSLVARCLVVHKYYSAIGRAWYWDFTF
jgi:hypothetical protein